MSWALVVVPPVVIFAMLMAALEVGFRLTRRGSLQSAGAASVGGVTGFVTLLIGLVLTFSFSNASGRLDFQRQLAVSEANAIGTAWARIDLFPATDQPGLRDQLRRYLDARIRANEALPDMAKYDALADEGQALQRLLWERTVAAVRDDRALGNLLVPAVNALGETASSRKMAVHTHITEMTLGLMIGLVLLGAFLIGTSGAEREGRIWPYRLIFAGVTSLAIGVIIDMEFPHTGVVATRAADTLLVELRRSMG